MSEEKRTEGIAGGPPPEGGAGDEVAGAERRRRAASGGFVPRGKPNRRARTVKPESKRGSEFTGEQRMLALDCWFRSELSATEFAPLIGVSAASLYTWRRKFEEEGPAGLLGHKRGMRGTRKAIDESHGVGRDRVYCEFRSNNAPRLLPLADGIRVLSCLRNVGLDLRVQLLAGTSLLLNDHRFNEGGLEFEDRDLARVSSCTEEVRFGTVSPVLIERQPPTGLLLIGQVRVKSEGAEDRRVALEVLLIGVLVIFAVGK